ncbi:MAG TPA: hypothetical protein VH595_02800 [Verrucomicrobiae bacterium]|jgi:hypothetical protein|nr:hypothetical protein [Verrucomicrobiae bacterium]
MKNYTEQILQHQSENGKTPVPVLTAEEQASMSESPAPHQVASTVESAVVEGRLAAAYAKMTPDQVKSLTWHQKILIAQGKSLDVDASDATERGAESSNYTGRCRAARKNEGGR